MLGHDLRNPLTAVSLGVELLRDAPDLPRRLLTNVDRLTHSVARMRHLIDDVLDFARGQLSDGIPVTLQPMSFEGLCNQMVAELSDAYPGRKIAVVVEGDTQGLWDPARLAQVVSNLVGNALQHCKLDPIELHLYGDPAKVTLQVRNAGTIDEHMLSRLFEPFQRGDSHASGLGLGSYIVREIVRAHGGTVIAKADQSLGQTAFIVELPRQPPGPTV